MLHDMKTSLGMDGKGWEEGRALVIKNVEKSGGSYLIKYEMG